MCSSIKVKINLVMIKLNLVFLHFINRSNTVESGLEGNHMIIVRSGFILDALRLKKDDLK